MRSVPAARGPVLLAVLLLGGLVLGGLVLPGCAVSRSTVGGAVPFSASGLVVGQTTKAETLARLGPPDVIHRQHDGDLFVYRQEATHSARLLLVPFVPIYEETRGRRQADVICLLFGQDGRLAGVGRQREIEP